MTGTPFDRLGWSYKPGDRVGIDMPRAAMATGTVVRRGTGRGVLVLKDGRTKPTWYDYSRLYLWGDR